MSENRVVVALDVGTTKICALVGEIDSTGQVHLLGMGQSVSEGLRKGLVVDIATTSRNIRDAIDAAGRSTGIDISSVVVGVTGEHVSSVNTRGVATLAQASREITEHDVHKVMESARAVAVPVGREVIHVLPRGFVVDGQTGVKQPVGMSGSRLEVDTHIIMGGTAFLQNVLKSVDGAGLTVESVVLEPVATCEAVLTQAEKDLGVVVADIGGGTTDVALVVDGYVAYSTIIPVGGSHVTNDLAIGLKTSRAEAERIKREFGCALATGVEDEDWIEIATTDGEGTRKSTRRAVADIIEPRMHELFLLIEDDLRRAGFEHAAAGVVLSGGGSLLAGSIELAQQVFDRPVRVGRPRNLVGPEPELDSPIYATAVGLLHFGAVRQIRELQEASTGRFMSNALAQLRHYISVRQIRLWISKFLVACL